jgi:hypothetical protein
MLKFTSLILASFALTGCCTSDVTAEKATLDVIEPAHRDYVEADEKLSEADKLRRLRLLDAWRTRVEAQLEAQKRAKGTK